MRIFIALENNIDPEPTQNFINQLSQLTEGYYVLYTTQILSKGNLTLDQHTNPWQFPTQNTIPLADPNCLGPIHLSGPDLKILLTASPVPITTQHENLITINPNRIHNPKTLSLTLAMLNEQLKPELTTINHNINP